MERSKDTDRSKETLTKYPRTVFSFFDRFQDFLDDFGRKKHREHGSTGSLSSEQKNTALSRESLAFRRQKRLVF